MHRTRMVLSTVIFLVAGTLAWAQPAPVASYFFNDTLAPQQAGVPSLVATDPLSANSFVTLSVFGQSRRVYDFVGNTTPAQQAGLTLDTTGLITPTNYSAELVFQFTQNNNAWRRIIDVQNRQSDNGFYVNPSNNLDVFPISGSTGAFTNSVFHHVVLTVNTGSIVKAYLDGTLQFQASSPLMNINNASNPGNLLNLFLDNLTGSGVGEFSSGDIALFRMYDAVLTDAEVAALAANPFAVPEPASILLMGIGVTGLGVCVWRGRRRRCLRRKKSLKVA
jgi:hypothetical protein